MGGYEFQVAAEDTLAGVYAVAVPYEPEISFEMSAKLIRMKTAFVYYPVSLPDPVSSHSVEVNVYRQIMQFVEKKAFLKIAGEDESVFTIMAVYG